MRRSRIDRIVQAFVPAVELREDFRQEALIHFWRQTIEHPGKTPGWYSESCLRFVRDRLKKGRSIDAPKRQHLRIVIDGAIAEPHAGPTPMLLAPGDPAQEVSVEDSLEVIRDRLAETHRRVLNLLFDGYRVREVARELHISHPAVLRSRRCIAMAAIQIGILPNCRPRAQSKTKTG